MRSVASRMRSTGRVTVILRRIASAAVPVSAKNSTTVSMTPATAGLLPGNALAARSYTSTVTVMTAANVRNSGAHRKSARTARRNALTGAPPYTPTRAR